ncbi:MAG: hypothetical protein P4L59_15440 [Desulfosporosinus sp.]|nr:hypothetical protein [Desulfosporosinus sp.]
MKKKLRVILVWTLISFLLQYGVYSILNSQVQKVMAPSTVASKLPITLQLKATIPGSDLTNIQISYAKDYLAYTENGALKVFNLKKNTVVFQKGLPSTNDKTLGVLMYQWLPDRNTLLYFYARKNPDPVTYVTVYPPKTTIQVPVPTPDPNLVVPKTEDPNQTIVQEVPKTVTKEVTVAPHIEKRYGNPQITELYSLELPNSDEDTAPNDRFNQTINNFPAGGKIKNLVVSTCTNLMYLTVKNASTELLLEIDVMKNVRTLSKSGETIDNMAASDRYGTLFLDSNEGGAHQVIAWDGTKRQTVSENSDDQILGIRDGKVYIGEVQNNELVKIKTTPDLTHMTKNPALTTEWEGVIPLNNNVRTLIGAQGQMIVYDHQTAYIVTAGRLTEVKLHGDENYVSGDGAELVQLSKQGVATLVELQPLKS